MNDFKSNWILYPEALNKKEIDVIQKIASKKELQPGTTFSESAKDDRSSKIAWLTEEKVANLFKDIVSHANTKLAFNLSENQPIMQYTEYHADNQDHYDWHHDIDWSRNDGFNRKLSVTIQLSDSKEYEGGEFEFEEVQTPPAELREKGSVLVFASYLRHRVKPVTKGIRKSLVTWLDGPNWV